MSDVSGPNEADEADLAEQRRTIGEDDPTSEPTVSPSEADEADALEQGSIITGEDEDYPHRNGDEEV